MLIWCNLNVPCWYNQWSDSLEVASEPFHMKSASSGSRSTSLLPSSGFIVYNRVRQHSENQSCLWLEMPFILLGPDRHGGMFDSLLGPEKSTLDWYSVLHYLQFKNHNIKLTCSQQNFLVLKIKLTTFVTIDGSILAKRERRSEKAAEIEDSW